MDLSRETLHNHNYTRRLYPPDLPTYFEGFAAFEEYDTNRCALMVVFWIYRWLPFLIQGHKSGELFRH
jgi:hypothetical protein